MENSELGFKRGDCHVDDDYEELVQSLPKEKELLHGFYYYYYQGFWVPDTVLPAVRSFQKNFVALDDDILLASCPKSGTTWLKSLSFSIVNRHRFPLSNSPLLTANPHALVLNLEFDVYEKSQFMETLSNMTNPRLLCTHVPYSSLPVSIKNSNCKIVYICRNPMDLFVSSWYFFCNVLVENQEPTATKEEYFDQFCRGVQFFGPSWDHVLEFWSASLENPRKFLFFKYEDLKKDTSSHVKKLAEFLGFPFSEEEEKEGVVEEIVKFCSIDNMKTLKGNVGGRRPSGALNNSYFRKGEVGDWKTHLTPSMVEGVTKIMQDKFEDSGLQIF